MILALFANPIVRKVLLYGAIAAGAWYALRLYSNSVWNKGFDSGRQDATAQIEKAKAAEWRAKEADLARQQYDLETLKDQTTAIAATFQKARKLDETELKKLISAIQEGRDQSNAAANAVPADELDSALRVLSAELATH